MAVFRDIDYNTRINGSLLVSQASTFSNNLDVDGILSIGNILNVETAIGNKLNLTGGTITGDITINGTLSATSISGVDLSNFYTKTQLNTSGGGGAVHWANITNKATATTSQAGIVQLSNSTNSTSTSLAATASAVKLAYDLADIKWVFDEEAIKTVKVNNAINADTVNSFSVGANVPAGAIFTDTIYYPPSSWPASMIEQDESHRFISDAQISIWNAKPSIDTTYSNGDGLSLVGTSFSIKLAASSGMSVDTNGLMNTDKGSSVLYFKTISASNGLAIPNSNSDTLSIIGTGSISTSANGKVINIFHEDEDHDSFALLEDDNVLSGINTFSSELIIQPDTAPEDITFIAIAWDNDKILLNTSVDALSEMIYLTSEGTNPCIRDIDYSIDYKRGIITRIPEGNIPTGGSVYISYVPTKVVFKVKGSASDTTDYLQIDNKGNIYGKSMTVTLSSSQNSQDSNTLGNFTIQGNLEVKGQSVLGDTNTDLTKINGKLSIYDGSLEKFTIDNTGIITIGSVPWARLTNIPIASELIPGIVTLTDSYGITSSVIAASATAVKETFNLANSKWTFDASIIQGIKVTNATNADTVGGLTVQTAVPLHAIFTDTKYSHPNHTGDVSSNKDGATTIGLNKVTNDKIRQSSGLSIIGNPTGSIANIQDIIASTDNQILKRNGLALEFGTIATGGITDKAVTLAKIQDVSASILLGRVTADTGRVEQLTATQVRTLLNVANGANNYLHPTQTAISTTNTAPIMIKDISVNTLGHVTSVASHTLTLNDLGFTGDTNANYYEHPANHSPSIITQSASYRFVTDTQISTWNAKSNLALGTTSVTAFRGDYGNTAYNHSQITHAPSNAQKNSDITKGEIEAKLTGDISTHAHYKALSVDSRDINDLPKDRDTGLYADFKRNATNGLNDGATYNGVLTFRPYGLATDFSGVPSFQLGFTSNGNIYKRRSLTDSTWDGWKKIWDEGSFLPTDYLPIAAERTLTGNLTIGTTGTNKNLIVNGTASIKNLNITSTNTITNLNADTVDGFHGREFFDSIFNIGGAGVVYGCKIEGLNTEFGCKLSSGQVFIKEYGIKNIVAIESFTGFTAGSYHLVFISGETTLDNSYVIGNIGVIVNASGWPSESLMPKNSILLAKVYPTNASAIGNANIYSCRKFLPIQSDISSGVVKIFESDKENAVASSSSFMTVNRLQISKAGDRTTIQLSDIPTSDSIEKSLLLQTDKITITENEVSKSITANKIINWDEANTKKHVHIYDASLQPGSTNGGKTFILVDYAVLTNSITRVYKNGLRQKFGIDYILSANTITFIVAPEPDDIIIIDYDQ